MSYVTIDIIKANRDDKWLRQITNDSGAGTMVDDTKLNRVVLEVNSLIDTYLREKYTLPLTVVSDMINGIALDLAICSLIIERLLPDVPEGLQKKNNDAMKLLEKVRTGELILDAGLLNTAGGGAINTRTQRFSSTVLGTF